MLLKAGARLASTCCATQVVVVRTPSGDVDLRCGGHPMVAVADAPSEKDTPAAGFDTGTAMGKRYSDEDAGVEVLCSKPGSGALSVGDTPLPIKEAKPLPSSD